MAGVRVPPTSWLPNELRDTINQDVADVFASAGLSEQSLTYRRFSAGVAPTVNVDTGVLSDPYTETTGVDAFVGAWKAHELAKRPLVRAGDLKVLMRKASVSGELTTADQLVYSGRTYSVVHVRAAQHAIDLVEVGARLLGGQGAA